LFRFFSNSRTTAVASGLSSGLAVGTWVGSFCGTPTFDYITAGGIRLNYSAIPESSSGLAGLLIAAGREL
jgi:hypothetical protein